MSCGVLDMSAGWRGSVRPCTTPPPRQPSPTQLDESRARVAARAARRWARSPSAGRTGARAACLWGAAEGGVCSEAGAAERERGGGQGAAAARRPGPQRRRCAQSCCRRAGGEGASRGRRWLPPHCRRGGRRRRCRTTPWASTPANSRRSVRGGARREALAGEGSCRACAWVCDDSVRAWSAALCGGPAAAHLLGRDLLLLARLQRLLHAPPLAVVSKPLRVCRLVGERLGRNQPAGAGWRSGGSARCAGNAARAGRGVEGWERLETAAICRRLTAPREDRPHTLDDRK